MRFAPSIPLGTTSMTAPTAEIVAQALRRFGEHSMVRAADLAPIPYVVRTHYRGFVGPAPQPRHPLWLLLDVAGGEQPTVGTDGVAIERYHRAQWQASLFAAGVRDRLCLAGARPLLGWSSTRSLPMNFNAGSAIAQRFPNPSRSVLRRRAQIVAERRGYELARVRFLHPFQDAPIVVFRTNDKKRFAHDVVAINNYLDPRVNASNQTAATYEGFFLEGEDTKGVPFLVTTQILRGEVSGSQWAWDPCFLPYAHSASFGSPENC
jgi:hypothetical protein